MQKQTNILINTEQKLILSRCDGLKKQKNKNEKKIKLFIWIYFDQSLNFIKL